MKKVVIPVILLLLQCYVVVYGREWLGLDGNPAVLFILFLLVPLYYLSVLKKGEAPMPVKPSVSNVLTGGILGLAALACTIPSLDKLFAEYNDPGKLSDVMTQLNALYERYTAGKFPYYPIEDYSWHPYPVYMPLNWLPLALSHIFHFDNRWIGALAMIVANGIWGIYVWRNKVNVIVKLLAISLPLFILIFYISYARMDIGVSMETLIAAYYMILAIGLLQKNIYMITIGLILCLLSRYTFVFWLPLFAIVYWQNIPRKTNIMMWGAVVLAVVVLYIIPFYMKDPTILKEGILYHNNCAVEEWDGYGEPPISYTFVPGIYFASYFKNLLPGNTPEQIYIMRVIQGSLMILLNIIGIVYYQRNKTRVDYSFYTLLMLFVFIMIFYMFSPLLYKYYHILTLSVSAMLCGAIMLSRNRETTP
ncbi:MAG: hypothetical protein ACK4EY_01025 [Flavipsychrobacter sp.]